MAFPLHPHPGDAAKSRTAKAGSFHPAIETETTGNMMNGFKDTILKRLEMSLHRSRPETGAGPLVVFSPRRQRRLGWKLLLCGRGRW
jgi:hypothetical protein